MTRWRKATAIAAAAISIAGLAGSALGATLVAPAVNHPVAVGPVSGENGFPVSYTDSAGVRLEGCLDGGDPLCGLIPDPGFNPALPTSFPDNFPEEHFYQLASATMPTGNAGVATLTEALEGAFANGGVAAGDQMVFGRFRVRITKAVPNAKYTITHPYGQDTVTANGAGLVFFTEDVGLTPGNFTGALSSRIGPFLKWDTGAPAGYLGDPKINHAITGSPFVDENGVRQNYFKVDGPGIGGTGIDTLKTDQFSVLGKVATNAGVGTPSATYTRTAAGRQVLDVYATSAPDQAIQVRGSGFDPTIMLGDAGRYFARIDFTGAPPPTVTLTNTGDKPVATKVTTVVDAVDISSAVYDTAAQTLSVTATSSDAATPPNLTVVGFGPMTAATTVFSNVTAPPATVTVSSTAGGSDSDTVRGGGPGVAPIAVQAFAGADATVQAGQTVTLDGSASTGGVTGYSWAQVGGPAVPLTGATTAKATFTAPVSADPLSFTL